jgi:YVTN family beta-propeller protein
MKQVAITMLAISMGTISFSQKTKAPTIIKTYHISSTAGWDYLAVNDNKLYVSHGTQVNILKEDTGDSIGFIPNTNGVHGIAFDNELNRGYTSNGRANNVTVFNLKTNDTLAKIATGENPDAINFEPFSKTIITCNGKSKDLTVINPKDNKVITTIAVGGRPEEAASDGNGMLYVNLEDKNEIAVVDLKTYKVLHHWSLSPGEGPTGLGIDRSTKRLFSTCDKLLVVIDAVTGKIVSKLPIGDGCDGVAFDTKTKMIYTSNGEGTLTAIQEENADTYKVVGNYATKKGARTIAIDQQKHLLFLPTSEFESPPTPGARAKLKPGTFQVLVIQE